MPREPLIRVLLDEHPVTGMGSAGYPPRGFDPARGSPGQARWFAISPQRGSQRYEPYGRWTPLRVSAQFFTNVSHTQTGNGGTKRGGPTFEPYLVSQLDDPFGRGAPSAEADTRGNGATAVRTKRLWPTVFS